MIMLPSKTRMPRWRLTYNFLQSFMDTQSALLTSPSHSLSIWPHLADVIAHHFHTFPPDVFSVRGMYLSENARSRRKMWPQYLHPSPQRVQPTAVMLLQLLFPISAWQRGRLQQWDPVENQVSHSAPIPLLAHVLFDLAWSTFGVHVLLEVIWK